MAKRGHASMAVTLNHYHGVIEQDDEQIQTIFGDLSCQTDKLVTMRLVDAG